MFKYFLFSMKKKKCFPSEFRNLYRRNEIRILEGERNHLELTHITLSNQDHMVNALEFGLLRNHPIFFFITLGVWANVP
jgi:hypothetical protein